jgi:hypothetical protein
VLAQRGFAAVVLKVILRLAVPASETTDQWDSQEKEEDGKEERERGGGGGGGGGGSCGGGLVFTNVHGEREGHSLQAASRARRKQEEPRRSCTCCTLPLVMKSASSTSCARRAT